MAQDSLQEASRQPPIVSGWAGGDTRSVKTLICVVAYSVTGSQSMTVTDGANDIIVRTQSNMHGPPHVKNASLSLLLGLQSTPHVSKRSQIYMTICISKVQARPSHNVIRQQSHVNNPAKSSLIDTSSDPAFPIPIVSGCDSGGMTYIGRKRRIGGGGDSLTDQVLRFTHPCGRSRSRPLHLPIPFFPFGERFIPPPT